MKKYPIVLAISGTDPSGGAGQQADIKAISATGGYAACAVTALVVQNTTGVRDVFPVPVLTIAGQIAAVFDDIGAQAVKIGMLNSSEVIRTVRDSLTHYGARNIVLDPVMVPHRPRQPHALRRPEHSARPGDGRHLRRQAHRRVGRQFAEDGTHPDGKGDHPEHP